MKEVPQRLASPSDDNVPCRKSQDDLSFKINVNIFSDKTVVYLSTIVVVAPQHTRWPQG